MLHVIGTTRQTTELFFTCWRRLPLLIIANGENQELVLRSHWDNIASPYRYIEITTQSITNQDYNKQILPIYLGLGWTLSWPRVSRSQPNRTAILQRGRSVCVCFIVYPLGCNTFPPFSLRGVQVSCVFRLCVYTKEHTNII